MPSLGAARGNLLSGLRFCWRPRRSPGMRGGRDGNDWAAPPLRAVRSGPAHPGRLGSDMRCCRTHVGVVTAAKREAPPGGRGFEAARQPAGPATARGGAIGVNDPAVGHP